ncbi:MCE family protein [Nocardia huaxiensis]|uniref:MCE family protein n=1 Tax=Nocardia huaxiensis TaxID=2755382 RepID=A0A7D6ZNH2_9NOCA|nr:MlaD family protein [Nocardia huaxiensis]QLY31543.1 MCE family protein [Nocardia huaxiensis]
MKLTKFVKIQLAIFSVLTVIGLSVMGGEYVRLPAMFGIGTYTVTVELAATGGLYETANVAYRGTNVGKVDEVRLTSKGVAAKLSIDSDYKVPADIDAYVKSVSAVGEQYVDLVPVESPKGGNLRDGAVIPMERTKLPQDVGAMLDQADRLLSTVADTKLQEVIQAAFTAFDGAGPELQRFIDSASLLVQEAKANAEPTKDLLAKLGPLLDTQVQSEDSIRSWTRDLATLTDQLREHDPALRSVLQSAPSTVQKVNQTFQDLKPTLPIVLANMISVGQVGVTYHAGVEQILVIYPPLLSGLLTAIRGPVEYGAMVDFMLGLNDPPGCTTGFLPAEERRSPAEWDQIPTPANMYCKVAQNANEAVRGIRNTPCMEVPGKRAPTPELCRDPQGYVPEGTNPPFGDPQPVDNTGQPTSNLLGNQTSPFIGHSDPVTGNFVGPDGSVYRQGGINPDGSTRVPSSWQEMLQEPTR